MRDGIIGRSVVVYVEDWDKFLEIRKEKRLTTAQAFELLIKLYKKTEAKK